MEWSISGLHPEHITQPVLELPLKNSIRHIRNINMLIVNCGFKKSYLNFRSQQAASCNIH